jgi:uncharacterized protein
MNKKLIIKKTEAFVRQRLSGETTGHDWWHTKRVCKMALKIAKEENDVDLFVVQLAALLHDIADWKFNQGNIKAGVKLAKEWLGKLKVDDEIISHVCKIISEVSFKGAGVVSKIKTKEGMIVQDADRLDALGAIGIARCFATGAKLGREIYNPKIKPKLHQNFSQYKKAKSTSINHFYEKLFLLKERMHTKTAKKIVKKRERLMKLFLKRFFEEWEGK